ncbi:LysR family transcriptional regulator [Haloferula luteola]
MTAAVRQMPYGIQQPAVSGQISQLEKEFMDCGKRSGATSDSKVW